MYNAWTTLTHFVQNNNRSVQDTQGITNEDSVHNIIHYLI